MASALGCAQPAPSAAPLAASVSAQAPALTASFATSTASAEVVSGAPTGPATAPPPTAEPALTYPTTPPLPLAQTSSAACTPGKAAPASLSDAQLFAEIKACGKQFPPGRGVLLHKEAQRRLRSRPPTRADIVDKMGFPTAGDHVSEIITWTRGAFTEKTADSVLVWQTYLSPMYWEFWYAVKSDRVVGSGSWDVPRD